MTDLCISNGIEVHVIIGSLLRTTAHYVKRDAVDRNMVPKTRACCKFLRIDSKILRRLFTTYSRESEIGGSVKFFDEIPRPPQVPILGNWHLYKSGLYNGSKYQNVLLHLYEKYGPVVYEKIGWRTPVIHVFDVDDVSTVYKNEDRSPRIFPLNELVKEYRDREKICAGLGQTNDEEWYRLKNGIRDLMLKTSNAQGFLPSMETVTDELVDAIQEERTRSHSHQINGLAGLIGRWNIEVGGKTVLNKKLGCLRGSDQGLASQIMKLNAEIFQLIAELKFSLPFNQYFRTPKSYKVMKKEHELHKITHKLIRDAIAEVKEANRNEKTSCNKFLETLVNKSDLSDDEIVVIASTLLLDSLSTTNPVLINNLYVLATHEDVQNKIHEQIVDVSKNKHSVDGDFLSKLTYLRATVRETFRLYPNGTEIARINKKPLILSNYHIPEGSHLSMNLSVHYRSPKYFPQPDTVLPERWFRDSPLYSQKNLFVLSPFGFGARTCAGRRFADQDLHVALYKILKRFRLTYPKDGPPLNSVFRTLIFPDDSNLPIQFIPRH